MIKNVLIAEDEPFLRETIRLVLLEHHVQVRIAVNGEDAIQLIDAAPPDLLLLDLLMPKKDGYGVMSHLRQQGFHFPVIILSNLSDELDQAKCVDLGAIGFLVKSDMDEEELWPSIGALLGAKAKE